MKPQLSLNVTDGAFDRFCNASQHNVLGSYLLCAFVGCLSLLIMCGNLLVITSVMYFKKLHTPTNYLILSLAVTDLLVGVFVLPFSTVLSLRSCGSIQALLCKVRNTFDMFLCESSILNLCFISVDRYYAVCRPLAYRTRITVRAVLLMILMTWTTSALLSVTVTLRGLDPVESTHKCPIIQVQNSGLPGLIFAFYFPALTILTLYFKILTVAHRQARSLQGQAKSRPAVGRTESKATKTLAIVVGVFLFSWSPFFLSLSLYPLSRNAVTLTVIEAFKWFGWFNSVLNPLVYAFFYKWFRSAFKKIISAKIFQRDLSDSKLS